MALHQRQCARRGQRTVRAAFEREEEFLGRLEAVRRICIKREIPVELALESPMACGYGACFGCAVPKTGGGYLRLCVDGPVVRGDEITTAMAGEAAVGTQS